MVNYSEHFPSAILAQGKNNAFFSLEKLEEPFKRADGKRVSYLLNYRDLSEECISEDDEAYVCVLSSENSFHSARELETELGIYPKRKKVVPDGYVIHDHLSY